MRLEPPVFAGLQLDTREQNACSPPNPGPFWRGILINAPSRATVTPPSVAIPICGYYLLTIGSLENGQPLRLFAENRRTGAILQGDVVEQDDNPEFPPPEDTPPITDEVRKQATGSYFNVNLLKYVPIPIEPGIWQVHATFGDATSNTVSIEISTPP